MTTSSYPILQPFKLGGDPRIQRRGTIDLTDEQAGPLLAAGLIGAPNNPPPEQQAGKGASDEAGETTPVAIPGPAPAAEPAPEAKPPAPAAKRATRVKKVV